MGIIWERSIRRSSCWSPSSSAAARPTSPAARWRSTWRPLAAARRLPAPPRARRPLHPLRAVRAARCCRSSIIVVDLSWFSSPSAGSAIRVTRAGQMAGQYSLALRARRRRSPGARAGRALAAVDVRRLSARQSSCARLPRRDTLPSSRGIRPGFTHRWIEVTDNSRGVVHMKKLIMAGVALSFGMALCRRRAAPTSRSRPSAR